MKLPLAFFKQSNYLKKIFCCWFKKGTNTNITNEFATVGMNLIGENKNKSSIFKFNY